MHRPTKDLDLLGTTADVEALKTVFVEIASIPCEPDGVFFDLDSVSAHAIREEQTYGGTRVNLTGFIGKARILLQVDIGFGDAVTPAPQRVDLPGMIEGIPAASMGCYNMETSFAEKLEAMARLGLANSRMKDFFDLAKMIKEGDLSNQTLTDAIQATFKRRKTDLPGGVPLALTEVFWSDPTVRIRWEAFVKKNTINPPFDNLGQNCEVIARTVLLVMQQNIGAEG